MSDQTIRASINTLMLAVPGIGVVHDYDRWLDTQSQLQALFQKNPGEPLHGWEITRDAILQLVRIAGNNYKITHSYVIRGYYALKDSAASEKLFNLVITAIIQKFIDNRLPDTEGHTLPTVPKIMPWMFAGILCHHAELRLQVIEIVAMTAEQASDLIKIHLTAYLAPDDAEVKQSEAEADITVQ
jgi:hypothetical protein